MEDIFQQYELEYIQDGDTSEEYSYDETGTRIETWSISTAETEQSYKMLFTRYEALEFLAFLCFNIKWLFINAICNLIVFIIITFLDAFAVKHKLEMNVIVVLTLTICYFVFLLDIISSTVHYWGINITIRIYKTKILPFIILDVLSLIVLIIDTVPGINTHVVVKYSGIIALVYKLHEIIEYFVIVSKMASKNTVMDMIRKYGMFYCVMVHVCILIWFTIGCSDPSCVNTDKTWTKYIREAGVKLETAQDWYFMCAYIMMSAFTSTGLGVNHGYNGLEAFILTVVSLLGLSTMNGIFLGGCTSVQIETYRRHAEYSEKIKNIKTKLTSKKLPRSLRRKIMAYYITCWIQLGGVLKAGHFDYLPEAIKLQINNDKYMNALNASHLLRHSHEAIRRAIANDMKTEVFTQGEVIFFQGVSNNRMIYLARGTIQILSGTDEESPIMSLEMGSVIGEVNLFLNIKSPVKVIASSYCVVHSIAKTDFWRVLVSCRKMRKNKNFCKIIKAKIKFAHKRELAKEEANGSSNSNISRVKTLKIMKQKLIEKKKNSEIIEENGRALDSVCDIYVVNKLTTVLRHADEICLKTSFPWILRPDSQLLFIWDTFIVLLALVTGIVYPYLIGFEETFVFGAIIFSYFVDISFLVDVLLQLFTAVENDQGTQSTLGDIFAIKIRSMAFIMDIISIFPIYFFTIIFGIECDDRMYAVVQSNRIFKLYKIISYLSKLENSFKINVAVIRGVKYVLYYVFLSYLIGTIWYMESCFYADKCIGWYAELEKVDLARDSVRTKSPFHVALSFVMLVISQTGFGGIYATNKQEMFFMMITNIFGVLTFTYLVADYSATLTLANEAFNQFSQMVHVIRKFMENNQMPDSLRNRTNNYLSAQWRYANDFVSHEFLTELPTYMFQEQRGAKYAYLFEKCPLFQGMDAPFLSMLASKSTLELLPPNEMLKYAGEKAKNMYIIESGYCVVISAISGKQEKIIGPGGYIYDFEMVMQQTGIFNIKSLTHLSLLKLSVAQLEKTMQYYPDFARDLDKITSEIKSSLAIQRIFVTGREVAYQQLEEEEAKSWYIFPQRKLDPRNIDYLQVFASMGIWKVTKLILMRRTLMSDGNFILLWELGRGFVVFIATILYPSVLIQQVYIDTFRYYLLMLDFVGLVDVYIRLHVCYYDKRGILVTHPKLTSIYYLTHSFIIDILSLLPLDLFLGFVVTTDTRQSMSFYLQIEAIMRFNKLLALYRFPCAFYYFRKDIFTPTTLTQNVIKFIVYSLVLYNLAAIILILISCDVAIENKLVTLTPRKRSWITYQRADYSFDITTPINLYISAFYFVNGIALSVSFGDLTPSTSSEMALVISLLIVGYLFFTYVFVIISNCRSNLNLNLTLYQQRMTHLIAFMKDEDIDKNLQRRAISHFEYNWQRTHGMKASVILNKCHTALREDCVLYLYERTLCEVQIFAEQSPSFYRYLGLQLEEAYFLRDFPIIRLNDIVNTVFIIHKGAVAVQGPDGTLFETLERGCVFGNIDEAAETRSMVTVVASKAVDLLVIKTTQFYEIIRDYPAIKHKLQKCILLENLCYIMTKRKKLRNIIDKEKYADKFVMEKETKKTMKSIKNYICSSQIDIFMMIFSYVSLMTVIHHAAFLQHHVVMFIVTYLLDVLHFIKLIAAFYTPYSDSMGELIRDPAWIRYRYLHSWHFYVELFALLPLEILCFVSKESYLNLLAMLRLNRCLRVFSVFYFFHKTKDYLNVNIIVVRLTKIFLFLIAVLHVVSSLLYMCACPFGKCDKDNWIMSQNGQPKCDFHYLCSFYYVTSIVTYSAYGDLSPRSIFDLIATVIILIGSKFLVANFAGDMSAMINSASYALVNYDYNLKKFHIYLKKHNITMNLIKKAMEYSHQLWKTNKGVQMPAILSEAPPYILEELMTAAYGKHLLDHFVFCQCHKDFLRLLTAKLQLFTFYSGDVICYQGEINDKMYFIHKGKVEVYAISSTEETQVDELRDLDCFGTVQGLFQDTPHTHTYISASVTVILTLNLKDWHHLLLFYPASRYEIYNKIQLI